MKKTDKRIDAYIDTSAEFAKPILRHIRALIHKACPDVEETYKWSFPFFDYKGPLCNMASFKQHCAFGFWKAALMKDSAILLATAGKEEAMGHLGRITNLKDLPKDAVLLRYIKEAMKLNEDGVKLPPKLKPGDKKELIVPADFLAKIKKNKQALKTFEEFSYSNKKEYVNWVTEAKTEATKLKRMESSIEWMSEGKIRNWKYVK